MSEASQALLQALTGAIVETVQAAGPQGAPSGPIYAALMQYGCDLQTFQLLVDYCINTKQITAKGHVLYATNL